MTTGALKEPRIAEKVIEKMESQKGFIQIPARSKQELIGDVALPVETSVNGNPARLDKYARIWSLSLKNKFNVGARVRISKAENGFLVELRKKEGAEETTEAIVERQPVVQEVDAANIEERPYFETDSISIFNEDILKTRSIEDNTVDLIVTSPPYNVDIQYENYRDDIPYNEYLVFTRKWLTKCYSLAKDDGRMCLNIPLDKNKGGQQSVCADITTIAKEVGWKYHATIIWNEQNISRRTAWGSWLSASAPFVIAPVEVIVVMYKKSWEKKHKGKSDIARDEFIEWTNGVWNFSGESRNKIGHPSPFPIELPKRCIKLFSYVGDAVLDPFSGSGTTLIACLENKRAGIGVEINRKYCELAVKRLEAYGIFQKKLVEIP